MIHLAIGLVAWMVTGVFLALALFCAGTIIAWAIIRTLRSRP